MKKKTDPVRIFEFSAFAQQVQSSWWMILVHSHTEGRITLLPNKHMRGRLRAKKQHKQSGETNIVRFVDVGFPHFNKVFDHLQVPASSSSQQRRNTSSGAVFNINLLLDESLANKKTEMREEAG
jgi:hypothetical protein